MILSVEKLNAFYGQSHITHDVSLEVEAGEMVCLIGRNGVGKTTVLKSVMGMTRIGSGKVIFADQNITGWPTFKISRQGLGYIPDYRGIFPELSVYENLRIGTVCARGENLEIFNQVYKIFPILQERSHQLAGLLSGGERQMLAIARALISKPRLLLIDEFSEGVQPNVVQAVTSALKDTNQREGIAVLFVEQDTRRALKMSRRAYIMEKGQIVYVGSAKELLLREDLLHEHLVI